MAKKFVKLTQTYNVTTIMDIKKNESKDHIMQRIQNHLDENGDDEVICLGGEVTFEILDEKPTKTDEYDFEMID